ncbi:MAG: hypothetical protein ACYTGJ_09155 [Planctomycetota bacterium]
MKLSLRPATVEPRPREWGGAPPALMISLLAIIVLLVGVVGYGLMTKGRGGEPTVGASPPDNSGELKALLKKIGEAERMKSEAMRLRTDDARQEEFQAKLQATLDFVLEVKDEWDAMLEPVRLPDGSLPPEYEGYNKDAQRLTYLSQDLVKMLGF